ncbi:MAG TPA: histidine phosphatase family protein [Candidatus Eubacterium faecavium]|nr:histidine phosphatase family protein [Candidatus Eubacterium faecavium]
MKTYTVYLFRHGITKGNINAQYIGHTDYPLTTDSISALRNIKAKYHYPQVEAVFSSPLKRCIESADIMFPKNNPIVINDFIEYNFGEFEECTAKDLENNEDFKNWMRGGMEARPPYGESNAEFIHRICAAFEKVVEGLIKTQTQTAAIVGHAGVLMTILSCYGLPEAPMAHWQMDPGYGFKLRITPSLWMQANKLEVADIAPAGTKEEP